MTNRQLLIDCLAYANEDADAPSQFTLQRSLRAALAEQCTAADEAPIAWLGLKGDQYGVKWFEVCDPEDHGAFKVYTHPPHPQAPEPSQKNAVAMIVIERDDTVAEGKTACVHYNNLCLELPIGNHPLYAHPEPPSSLTGGQGKERIEALLAASPAPTKQADGSEAGK